ncbi:MAG: L-threonylcarbamoyladenylate synthase [Candidatus Diapherotrites archaeon]
MNGKISKAVESLRKGGVIVYPTETSYGLGASIECIGAIRRIKKIKGRDGRKPISIIVSSAKMAEKYCVLGNDAKKLMREFMPGPLTLVVDKKKTVTKELTREKTIAFRVSSNRTANAIVKALGVPITATSANKSGDKPIYLGKKAEKEFAGKVDFVLNAGNLRRRKVSTVFSVMEKKILRKGKISEKEILRVLK